MDLSFEFRSVSRIFFFFKVNLILKPAIYKLSSSYPFSHSSTHQEFPLWFPKWLKNFSYSAHEAADSEKFDNLTGPDMLLWGWSSSGCKAKLLSSPISSQRMPGHIASDEAGCSWKTPAPSTFAQHRADIIPVCHCVVFTNETITPHSEPAAQHSTDEAARNQWDMKTL